VVTTRGRLVDEAGQKAMVDVLEQAGASSGSELSATSWTGPSDWSARRCAPSSLGLRSGCRAPAVR
jgi:hypothetical protein